MIVQSLKQNPLIIATLIVLILCFAVVISPLFIFDDDGPLSRTGIDQALTNTSTYLIEFSDSDSSNQQQSAKLLSNHTSSLLSILQLEQWQHKLRFGQMHRTQKAMIILSSNELKLFFYPSINLVEASIGNRSSYYRLPEEVIDGLLDLITD